MTKNLAIAIGQLGVFGGMTLVGIKVLQPPKALPDPKSLRRAAILETAAQRKFEIPDAMTLTRGLGFKSTKDGNAGELYLQALKATYTEPGVKPTFDRFLAAQGPAAEAARRQAASELFASKPVKLIEQGVQMTRCSITADTLAVKSFLDLNNSVVLPAQLLGGYVDVLALKGDSYGQAGRRDFQKMYYQAGLTLGAHLTQDLSPAAQLAGLNAIIDSSKRFQQAGDPDAAKLQAVVTQLGDAYKKENLEDVLVLAGEGIGLRQLEQWLGQGTFVRAYGFWAIYAALTQWSPQEFMLTGVSDERRQFLQDMAGANIPSISKLGQAAAKDLDTLAQKWATLPSSQREGFRQDVESRPIALVDRQVQALYGSPLSLTSTNPFPSKKQ